MWPVRNREERFCAFCKSKRKVYMKKHVGLTNVLGALIAAVVLSVLVYGEMDPRLLVFFGCFLILAEVFVYTRWRSGLICKMCGFDPITYKKSPALAAERVRNFFERQAANPEFFLSKSPLLEIHRRMRAAQLAAARANVARKQPEKPALEKKSRPSVAPAANPRPALKTP